MIYLIIALVIIVIGLGGYFVIKNNGTSSDKTSNPAGQSTTSQVANTVVIKDFAFSPSNLTVAKGMTVTWKNEDSMTHTVKSDSFASQDLATGDTFQFTFNSAGTFDYICSIHPSMKGTVTVQ